MDLLFSYLIGMCLVVILSASIVLSGVLVYAGMFKLFNKFVYEKPREEDDGTVSLVSLLVVATIWLGIFSGIYCIFK